MTADVETLRALLERVSANAEADTNGGCWLWAGSAYLDKRYGRPKPYIMVDGRQMLAHRAAVLADGRDPAGHFVCHKCDNPWCVNPRHLYLGDHASNMRDMTERRRYFAARNPEACREAGRKAGLMNDWAGGERNPKAKITDEQARAIKADGRPTRVLAVGYGVDRTTIQRIRRGALWN